MNPLLGGLISGGASLIGGLLDKPKSNKAMNSSIRKSNREAVAKANAQEKLWNKAVQARADKAAKVPIVTKTKYGSKESETTTQQYGSKETQSYGRRTDTASYVDFKGMMAAAEKSGFNPVTFLNAGGLQAFTRTISKDSGQDVLQRSGKDVTTVVRSKSGQDVETVTGSTAMQAALVGLDKPAFHYYEGATDATQQTGTSLGQAFGNAANAGVNTYLSQRQQLDQNEFQQALVRQQLVAANQRGNGQGYSLGGVPSMRSSYSTVNIGGGRSLPSGGKAVSTITPWGRLTNPNPLGSKAYEQFGEILGPFVQLGSEGPAMWRDPGNQKATSDAAKAWYWGADDLVGAGIKKSWNDFVQGTKVGPWRPLTSITWTKPGTKLRGK